MMMGMNMPVRRSLSLNWSRSVHPSNFGEIPNTSSTRLVHALSQGKESPEADYVGHAPHWICSVQRFLVLDDWKLVCRPPKSNLYHFPIYLRRS